MIHRRRHWGSRTPTPVTALLPPPLPAQTSPNHLSCLRCSWDSQGSRTTHPTLCLWRQVQLATLSTCLPYPGVHVQGKKLRNTDDGNLTADLWSDCHAWVMGRQWPGRTYCDLGFSAPLLPALHRIKLDMLASARTFRNTATPERNDINPATPWMTTGAITGVTVADGQEMGPGGGHATCPSLTPGLTHSHNVCISAPSETNSTAHRNTYTKKHKP